ncbi:UNVERIFIED_CONTAM: hypothetical protein GTU68_028104 [Idotea baltica]|nr:hypothetical protein [Idotea baltica]
MKSEVNSLLNSIEGAGLSDRRNLSRAISRVENNDSAFRLELANRFSRTGDSVVYGITGSPGAGKSTLVDLLARKFADTGKTVAVLAIDPSSPFSGGALLGDRIRMSQASAHPNIYIRSMASRGALGGLAHSTREVIFLLELVGFDIIILETVGVGQAEVEIVKTADTVGLVLVPGMGDGVQALKAGIIEIADLFIINKADYPDVDKLHKELRRVISLAAEGSFEPNIVRTIASKAEGIDDVVSGLQAHRKKMAESGELATRKQEFLLQTFRMELYALVSERFLNDKASKKLREDLEKSICKRELSPLLAAMKLIESI